jgi:hypothetical protein
MVSHATYRVKPGSIDARSLRTREDLSDAVVRIAREGGPLVRREVARVSGYSPCTVRFHGGTKEVLRMAAERRVDELGVILFGNAKAPAWAVADALIGAAGRKHSAMATRHRLVEAIERVLRERKSLTVANIAAAAGCAVWQVHVHGGLRRLLHVAIETRRPALSSALFGRDDATWEEVRVGVDAALTLARSRLRSAWHAARRGVR